MILTVVKVAVLVYGSALVFFWAAQERLLFHPYATVWQTPADFGQPYREITVATADGLTLSAWYVPPPAPEAPVIWYLSGNGGNRASWAKVLAAAGRRGYGAFVCDWRGYGGNPGKPSEAGFLTDAAAAWKTLTQDLSVPPGRILVWGKSLGGTIAAQTTAAILASGERPPGPRGLVLDCTFADLMNVARSHYPWLPVATLARHAFDATPALTAIGRSGLPVLVVHGQQDEVVDIKEGRALARLLEAAGTRPAFVERPGGHNLDLWLEGGHAAVAVEGWIKGLQGDGEGASGGQRG